MAYPPKGRADYYAPGDWNVACSMCGRKRKASWMVKNWQGQYRCPEHNEARQPQDFVRAVTDDMSVPWSQPETDIDILFCDFDGQSAIPDIAIPDCSIPDKPDLLSGPLIPPSSPAWSADSTEITADSTLFTADG